MVMADNLTETVNDFCIRSQKLKKTGNLVILPSIGLLLICFLLFVYFSSTIAALDIERHRRAIEPKEDLVDKLVSLKLQVPEVKRQLYEKWQNYLQIRYDKREYSYEEIQKLKDTLGDHLHFLDDITVDYESFGTIDYPKNLTGDTASTRLIPFENDLEDIYKIRNELIERLEILKSPELKDHILNPIIDSIKSYNDQIKTFEKRIEDSNAKIEELNKIEPLRPYIINEIQNLQSDIMGDSKSIHNIQIGIGKKENDIKEINENYKAKYSIDNSIKLAENAIKMIDDVTPKIKQFISKKKDEKEKIKKEIENLEAKEAKLDSQIKIYENQPMVSSNEEKEDKISFVITANVTRFVGVIVTIFFAQVLLSLYRYTIRLSTFYQSRADVLTILTQAGLTGQLSESIQPYAEVFTPYGVDFGKIPNTNLDEIMKIISNASRK